jgi:large subunit ribosomal protein L30
MTETLYAIILVRGFSESTRAVEDTLRMMNLTRVNHCSVMRKTKSLDGMLLKARGNVTWGRIKDGMLLKLVAKRGRLAGDRKLSGKQAEEETKNLLEGKKPAIKKVFRLNPPSKGYRAVKRMYPEGDLGFRGDEINRLLNRMI